MEQAAGVGSIQKAWAIMDLLASQEPMSLSQVAATLKLPKSSTLRMLNTLIELEVVSLSETGARDKLYTIDYRALRIANKILQRSTLRNQASPYLYALADQTGAIANLGVLSGNVAVLIEKVVLHVPFPIVHSDIGGQVPAHASSVAKVILAHRPQNWVDTFLASYPFRQITKGTITNAEAFKKELEIVSTLGYAVNNEELLVGVVSIAMPIYNYEGFCIAALALSKEEHIHQLPSNPLDAFNQAEIAALNENANRISFSLGYHSKQFLVDSAVWQAK